MLVGPESDGYVMECGKGDPNDNSYVCWDMIPEGCRNETNMKEK